MTGGTREAPVNISPAVAANAEGEEIEVLESTEVIPVAPEEVGLHNVASSEHMTPVTFWHFHSYESGPSASFSLSEVKHSPSKINFRKPFVHNSVAQLTKTSVLQRHEMEFKILFILLRAELVKAPSTLLHLFPKTHAHSILPFTHNEAHFWYLVIFCCGSLTVMIR